MGLLAAGVVAARFALGRPPERDFDQVWVAARAFWQGKDAYALIGPHRAYDLEWPFLYPLTAAVIIGPLALLPVAVARAAFAGISSALLAFGITRDGYDRLLIFTSVCYLFAVRNGQWSPLLTAAMCMPALAWVYAAKPNIGLAILAADARPRVVKIALVGGLAILLVTVIGAPDWIARWLTAVRQGSVQVAPVLTRIGWIALLALLRWRRPEARLIVALACVPFTQSVYDYLPLFLVPVGWQETAALSLSSNVSMLLRMQWAEHMARTGVVRSTTQALSDPMMPTLSALFIVLPALVMVLRRPNEGYVPAWLDRLTRRIPALVRQAVPRP